jgi:hypothetical protein
MSVTYEYFGPHGERRTAVQDEREGAQRIGERVMVGFPCVHRYTESPDGGLVTVVYFQAEVTGSVWALYYT